MTKWQIFQRTAKSFPGIPLHKLTFCRTLLKFFADIWYNKPYSVCSCPDGFARPVCFLQKNPMQPVSLQRQRPQYPCDSGTNRQEDGYLYYTSIIIICWLSLAALSVLVYKNSHISDASKRLLWLAYELIAVSALA